jgi:hypothetical protein
MDAFGFQTEEIARNEYLATRNVEIVASRNRAPATKEEAIRAAGEYLALFTLDESDFEVRLLELWLAAFRAQLDRTFAASP